jgi:flagellin
VNSGTGGVFQIGPDDSVNNRIEVNVNDMRASGAFVGLGGLSVASQTSAQTAISTIDLAINKVSQVRGDLGAYQNRLSYNLRNTENSVENNQASESTIRDADIGEEVSQFTRYQVLSQATNAMLAQANVLPQNALSLLQ